MKKCFWLSASFCILLLAQKTITHQSALTGAWTATQGNISYTLVFQDGYFSFASFNIPEKTFIQTYGGTFTQSGGQLHTHLEFDTKNPNDVGSDKNFTAVISGNLLKLDPGNGITDWKRTDEGKEALAGNWRITGRMNNGNIQEIPLRARKTIKLLSTTRFQWIAINTDSKEFFGTGGGTYIFKDGNYTENIEFFSRDSSRVGASLRFDGSVNNNVWTHKGLSSKGEPIHEEWTREK